MLNRRFPSLLFGAACLMTLAGLTAAAHAAAPSRQYADDAWPFRGPLPDYTDGRPFSAEGYALRFRFASQGRCSRSPRPFTTPFNGDIPAPLIGDVAMIDDVHGRSSDEGPKVAVVWPGAREQLQRAAEAKAAKVVYTPPAPAESAPSALDLARAALQRGDAAAATDHYRLIASTDDWVESARGPVARELAIARLLAGHPDEAAAVFALAYERDPALAASAMDPGLIGTRASGPSRWDGLLRAAVRHAHRVDSASAWLQVAVLMQAQGPSKWPAARRMLDRAQARGLAEPVASALGAALSPAPEPAPSATPAEATPEAAADGPKP